MKLSGELQRRLSDRVEAWGVEVERLAGTETAILAFGRRDQQAVVLKIIRYPGNEWQSGAVLSAFRGHGAVRVLNHVEGAILLERAEPGDVLAHMPATEDDDRATAILAAVIGRMSPAEPPEAVPASEDWGRSFGRYAAGGDSQIPRPLLETAAEVYGRLCASQSGRRLLHGDLHHGNVLLDSRRGWLAVDPKGVIGELEFETAAALRNPCERPDLFTDPATIERRVNRFARELQRDAGRIRAWAFAQAVLAAVWLVEDGVPVGRSHPWLVLAERIEPV